MTFGQLITEVQRLTGRNDSTFSDRIKQAINDAIKSWARVLPWPTLEIEDEVTHIGGRYLYFPGNVSKIIWLLDKTNKREVVFSDLSWDRAYTSSLSQDTAGRAVEAEPAGIQCAVTSISGPLQIYSTAASDVLGVYIQGSKVHTPASGVSINSNYNKHDAVEEVSVAGATPVTSVNTYVAVQAIGKTADSDGAILIKCGNSIVSIIGPLEREASYRRLALMNIPAANTVFKYRAYTDPPKLVNTNQTPPPSVSPEYIKWMAASDIYFQMRENERSQAAQATAGRIAQQYMKKERLYGGASGGRVEPEDFS